METENLFKYFDAAPVEGDPRIHKQWTCPAARGIQFFFK
jgi:hypothetical protein